MARRVKWEQAKVGNVGMALVALDREDEGRAWVDPSLDRPHKRRLPPRRGHGQDGSYNFAPGLLAGGAYWRELADVLDEYWRRGGGNEFGSPLYSCRVYTAAALLALLGPERGRSMLFLKRWTAFLALQAIVVRNQRPREQFTWAGEPATMRHLTRTGLVIPPTGMRVNHSLGETLVAPILAHVLGVRQQLHRRWTGWRRWRPPANKKEAGRMGPMPPLGLVAVVENAEARVGVRLAADPWMRYCRDVALGQMRKWRELADRLQEQGEVPGLGRGCTRFGIDRRPEAVGTWLEGSLATMQKPGIPAAYIEAGGDHTRVLAPSAFEIPSTIVRSRVDSSRVRAEGDVEASLPRLAGPQAAVVFEGARWWQ